MRRGSDLQCRQLLKHRFFTSLLSLLILAFLKLNSQIFPTGFSQVKIAGLSEGSAMAFAPDGRLFVCQKNGIVRIIKNGTLLSTPFITLTVDINGERGISGITLDPAFTTNHYVYIYYTATSPTIHNRLSRFTANGDIALSGSEVILLEIETANSIYHNGGGIGFGPDGKLYLAIGEDNTPNNAQNMGTYKGKLLRLNADGTAPNDNPFISSSSQITKRIWCLGLRNPYTLAFHPTSGKLFVNNVGADSYEEIHDATLPGQNFGWPIVEGNSTNPDYANPVFVYPHDSTGQTGCAITGGTFFNPTATNYPAHYINKYFYLDYCNGWINYINHEGTITNSFFCSKLTTQNLALQLGPDGNLYYLNRFDTKAGVYKIIYTNTNAPVITSHPASQTVSEGQPVTFSVSVTGTEPITYQWKKNGASISGTNAGTFTISSTTASDEGQYTVLVTNAFGSALSNAATLTVTSFNAPPSPRIIAPVNGNFYRAGEVVNFSGSANDPEDGDLPASAFEWTVEFWHNNDHFHPGPVIPAGIKNGSFTISNTGEPSANVFYRIKLKVTDSRGLSSTVQSDILPLTSTLNFRTQPPGLQITFDSQPKSTPFSTLTVEGLNIPIGAVSPQSKDGLAYSFKRWEHGGNNSQTIKVGPGDSSYTAVFDTLKSCAASGTIVREFWANVTGTTISSIPVNSVPTSTTVLTIFEGPSNVAENYGSRIRGYICPPLSGNYVFWIASDNDSELWLSTDDQPSNKIRIASVKGYTSSRQWTKYSTQQSAPVNLVGGVRYYIEAIHREGTLGDNLAVGWQLPDGTLERPIPGSRLSPYDAAPPQGSPTELIPANAAWKYLDNGTNQGTAWRTNSFDDSSWKTGNAELGYGDGGEATLISYGPSPTNKYITTYFRKKFNVSTRSGISGLELRLLRDDGAVVYLNGTEIFRSNMPSGTISYTTLAPSYIDGANESTYIIANLSASALLEGENVIAVEIHQQSVTSSDISFDLALKTLASGSIISYTPGIFAVIGDYGFSGPNEAAVANLVKSWEPEFIITVGDNNYPDGAAETVDANIGQYYHDYIFPYSGSYGNAADINRFFPSLGNHDLVTNSGAAYYAYFTLPGNERYYDFVKGDIHFFVLNSNSSEADGNTSSSVQGNWLKNKLFASASKWKIVYFHHSPYASSVQHGSQAWMQWPFKDWGADIVLSSHAHIYERLLIDGFPYIVNGLGGKSIYDLSSPAPGSVVRYNGNFGGLKVEVKTDTLWFRFYNINKTLIDSYPLVKSASPGITCTITAPVNNATFISPANINIAATVTASGPISKVEFLQGSTKIGEDLTSPYSFAWMNIPTGNYSLRAVATDAAGNSDTSNRVNISVVSCATPTITPSGPLRMCSGSVTLNATAGAGFSYQWKKDGVNISSATNSSYTASASGDYQVRITIGSCISWSAPVKVRIESGLAATITPGGPTTFCQGGNVILYGNTCSGFTYQWKKDGLNISGATSTTFTATASGTYQLKVTQNGINAWSSLLTITVNPCDAAENVPASEAIQDSSKTFYLEVFPNPNSGLLTMMVKLPGIVNEKIKVRILDMNGKEKFVKHFPLNNDYLLESIELDASVPGGIYFIETTIGTMVERTRILLMK